MCLLAFFGFEPTKDMMYKHPIFYNRYLTLSKATAQENH